MLDGRTVSVVAGVGAAALLGYCIYFDHKRRSAPDFKEKLKVYNFKKAPFVLTFDKFFDKNSSKFVYNFQSSIRFDLTSFLAKICESLFTF